MRVLMHDKPEAFNGCERSVKGAWTGFAFPTNESAWSVINGHGLSVLCVKSLG